MVIEDTLKYRIYPYNLFHSILNHDVKYKLNKIDVNSNFDKNRFDYCIHQLTERDQKVIELRYQKGLSYRACGKELDLSGENVRRLDMKILMKLWRVYDNYILAP